MIIVFIIISLPFVVGLFFFMKGIYLLFKAFYYRYLASEKAVDSVIFEEMKGTEEYSKFKNELDSLIN